MDSEQIEVRDYRPDDLEALYRVCVLTSHDGQDGTALFSDPELPGHVYAGPYAIFEPSLAFVAEDAEGVGGYIVGALDSRAFERRLERDWWPGLRDRYPEPAPDAAERLSMQERRAIGNIHHYFSAPEAVTERFPSHLHINLVPRMQGRGAGRRLVAALTSRLRQNASPGLHLLVAESNQKAAGFYQHIGFTEVPGAGSRIFTMQLADLDRREPPSCLSAG